MMRRPMQDYNAADSTTERLIESSGHLFPNIRTEHIAPRRRIVTAALNTG